MCVLQWVTDTGRFTSHEPPVVLSTCNRAVLDEEARRWKNQTT